MSGMIILKTLIFNGSPRNNGDTIYLINMLTSRLQGEIKIVNTYQADISPCIDCRWCWKNDDCSINDDMTEIYDYIIDCENIVIASPIFFSQPTGKLLDVCSRFQKYFTSKYFRKKTNDIKTKRAAVILVGGGDGNPENAYKTICTILNLINVTEIYPLVGSFKTNTVPVDKDSKTTCDICKISEFLNYEKT